MKTEHNIVITVKYASHMMRRTGFRSRRTQKRPMQRNRDTYQQEVMDFRATWKRVDCSSYYVMDEAGAWNDSVVLRTFARTGSGTPSIKTDANSTRDTVVATLCGDGSKLPLYYIQHQRQKSKKKVITQPAVKGMNGSIMLDYIQKILAPNLKPGDTLFMDRLSSHLTQPVRLAMNALHINVVYFPAKAAPDLLPCDNFFFHLFKDIFRKKDRSSILLKRKAAFEAYDAVTPSSVRACWRKCGLLVNPPPIDLTEDLEQDEVLVIEEGLE